MMSSSRPAPRPRKKKRIPARHGWVNYEAFKQSLQHRNLTPMEYQHEVARYCAKHGL